MQGFAALIAIVNVAICFGCFLWYGLDRSASPGPGIVSVIAFNMAMAWLIVAGLRQDDDGRRTWTARPAIGILGLAIIIGATAVLRAR